MILVFGRSGQLAQALANRPDVTALGRDSVDLAADPDAAGRAIDRLRPQAVINAAAYTAVDRAEAEPDSARRINADAPAAMARACAGLGIPLVHVSTDYVFDGSGTAPWRPDDPTAPLNVYGATKLAGEAAVRAAGGTHAIVRTAWVFAPAADNFVTAMLRLGRTRPALDVVADQIGGPTPAADLAAACLRMAAALRLTAGKTGTYHLAGGPDIGRADFARAIFAAAGLAVQVRDIASAGWPTPAARPLNSRLDCTSTETVFGLTRPDWRAALPGVLAAAAKRS